MIVFLKVLPLSLSTYPSRANLWYLVVEVFCLLAWHQRSKNPCAHTPIESSACLNLVPYKCLTIPTQNCSFERTTIFHTYTGGVKVSFGSSRNDQSWWGGKRN